MPFYTSKDALLHCKRASFTTQKGVDGKTKWKEIDKKSGTKKRETAQNQREGASPSPSGGGDVRGNGGRRRLTTALRKEGMCLAGYRILGVGDIKEKRIKPQRLRFNSQYCRV